MIPPSVERIERSGFSVWSPDETTTIGGWTVASSGGYTRRLNSAAAIGGADTSIETRDAIATWLSDRGSPLTVRVTPLIDPATTVACAGTWGLDAVDETLVLTGRPVASNGDGGVRVVDARDPDFTTELFALNHRGPDVAGPWSRIAERIGPHGAGLWIPGKAVGFVAVHDGIASVFSVAVRPEARRTGLATRIMESAAMWAVQMGADSMFMQVVGTNAAALRLYEGLGFAETYRYHYLQPSHAGH